MLITSQNLIVEPEYVEALNERIETLEQPDSNDQVSVQVPLSVVYPDSVVIEEDQTSKFFFFVPSTFSLINDKLLSKRSVLCLS